MVKASAEPKGLRTVLKERGVSTTGMLKADMVNILDKMHDFQYKKTRVEEFVCSHGHSCLFLNHIIPVNTPLNRFGGKPKCTPMHEL